MIMTGIGTPSSQSRMPRPILPSPSDADRDKAFRLLPLNRRWMHKQVTRRPTAVRLPPARFGSALSFAPLNAVREWLGHVQLLEPNPRAGATTRADHPTGGRLRCLLMPYRRAGSAVPFDVLTKPLSGAEAARKSAVRTRDRGPPAAVSEYATHLSRDAWLFPPDANGGR
jgi:hypothetical protein